MKIHTQKNYSAQIIVKDVIRGAKANDIVAGSYQFNDTPKDGYEYIIASVDFTLLSVQDDASISANYYDFDWYTSNNEEYEQCSVVLNNKLDTKLYAGGHTEGYIVNLIKKDDPTPKLAYGLDYNGQGGIWFSLK